MRKLLQLGIKVELLISNGVFITSEMWAFSTLPHRRSSGLGAIINSSEGLNAFRWRRPESCLSVIAGGT
jgi:hypothetical protein